jgi:hypothetical protein
MVYQWFDFKITRMVSSGLASKLMVDDSPGLASKLVASGFPV